MINCIITSFIVIIILNTIQNLKIINFVSNGIMSYHTCILVHFVIETNLTDTIKPVRGARQQSEVPPVQYERRIVRAGCCGGFVAQRGYGSFSQTPWVRAPQLPVFCFSPFSFLSSRLISN